MRLDEIVQKGGKITGSEVEKINDKYWEVASDSIIIDQDGFPITMTKKRLLANDYEPYEPQIVPKEAGELWVNKFGVKMFTVYKEKELWCYFSNGPDNCPLSEGHCVIHGNGIWTRLHPEVPDPNIERVVIEGVEFRNDLGVTVPLWPRGEAKLKKIPTSKICKLTFEWNKE